MINILHGDDITASRNYYHDSKQKSENPLTFEGDKVTITELTQAMQGGGLFVEKQTIFLENLLSKKKDGKELAAIASVLDENAKTHDITLWENKELTKKQLEIIKNAQTKIFKLPQSLFAFLESLKPNNTTQSLRLFHQTLETAEVEMIFFMMIRQLRILLALHDPASSIDEVKRMAPWQQGKLRNQAKLFSPTQLSNLYQKLAILDKKHKTGTNTALLSTTIDFLLLEV